MAGQVEVTHLIVPAPLQAVGAPPRALCGLAYSLAATSISLDGDVGAVNRCDKCLPRLSRKVAARTEALGRRGAGDLVAAPGADVTLELVEA